MEPKKTGTAEVSLPDSRKGQKKKKKGQRAKKKEIQYVGK
jgi:hypothetical protein